MAKSTTNGKLARFYSNVLVAFLITKQYFLKLLDSYAILAFCEHSGIFIV